MRNYAWISARIFIILCAKIMNIFSSCFKLQKKTYRQHFLRHMISLDDFVKKAGDKFTGYYTCTSISCHLLRKRRLGLLPFIWIRHWTRDGLCKWLGLEISCSFVFSEFFAVLLTRSEASMSRHNPCLTCDELRQARITQTEFTVQTFHVWLLFIFIARQHADNAILILSVCLSNADIVSEPFYRSSKFSPTSGRAISLVLQPKIPYKIRWVTLSTVSLNTGG